MKMTNKLLAGAALMMAAFSFNQAQATSCAVPPTCTQLGYTMKKADCGEYPVMRCPFALTDDNQVFCQKSVKLTALPILYGDGTVSKKVISGKTPIGFVFDETNRLAVALTDVKADGTAGSQTMKWSDEQIDTPLENCKKENLNSCGTDGRKNTDTLLKITTGTYYAAQAVNKYEPSGCTVSLCKKGKWFLPSVRDLENIKAIDNRIEMTSMLFNVLGIASEWEGGSWSGNTYWSSNETEKKEEAWVLQMVNNYAVNTPKDQNRYVRPVVKY